MFSQLARGGHIQTLLKKKGIQNKFNIKYYGVVFIELFIYYYRKKNMFIGIVEI